MASLQLYKYYQKVGGNESWIPAKYNQDLSVEKPTFETILGLDTLVDSDPDPEQRERIKYYGPLYFDIDADDLEDSIASARELHKKLTDEGLTEHDIEVYLSGKKGFHLIVPPTSFMEKPEPVAKLPHIYREIANKFAVPFMDFRVYTAKRGRMLRTTHNQRENGLYKVAITKPQLDNLTEESYRELASKPTGPALVRPTLSAKFALVYAAAAQKVGKWQPKKSKPPSQDILKRDLIYVNKLLRNEGEGDMGFNQIATQLAVYAREVGWSEDTLVGAATKLLNEHSSDGCRYNTPSRRVAELRRMCQYAEDNPGCTYRTSALVKAAGGKKVQIAVPVQPEPAQEGSEAEGAEPAQVGQELDQPDKAFQHIRLLREGMFIDSGDNMKKICEAYFGNVAISHVVNGEVASVKVDIFKETEAVARGINLPAEAFTSSSSLHREMVRFGFAFMGGDQDARGVLGALLGTVEEAKQIETSCCGLDLVRLPGSPHEVLKDGVLVWAAKEGCKVPPWAEPFIKFGFTEDPTHQGVPDLLEAPHPSELFSSHEGKLRLAKVWRALWESNEPSTIGQVYGWVAACFYSSLIRAATDQFPLLHVAGAAGYGKTQNIRLAASMHSYRVRLPETTPNSTPFALGQLLSCYASTPVMLDEYKPHRMSEAKLEGFRSLMRDAYNGKSSLRGGGGSGGSGSKGASWRGLSATPIKAPIIFIAEALETETAILERSVPVTFTRRRGRGDTFARFSYVQQNREVLSSLGRGLTEDVLTYATLASVSEQMTDLTQKLSKEMRQPLPTDSQDTARARRNITERPLHNTACLIFGLDKLHAKVLELLDGDEFVRERAEFREAHAQALEAMKAALLEACGTAMPEMVKFLIDVAELTRSGELSRTDSAMLVERGGELFLQLVPRAVFNSYRRWARSCGAQTYYASPESVIHALRNFDGFRPGLSDTERVLLEWETLKDYGMCAWHTKAVTYK